jgi:hypothetical protein
MAETSFPFENVDVSETQFSRWARNFQDYGVKGVPGDGNLLVSGDDSGLQVRVAAGQAFIRGHYYINTAQATVTILSSGTNTRIDAIVLELDPVANSVSLKAIRGDEVTSDPVAPELTQTDIGVYQMLLAYLTIPASTSSILSSMITDKRTFMGQRVGIWTTGTRPANPITNLTLGYNATIGYHEVWKGSEWAPFQPDQASPFLHMGA